MAFIDYESVGEFEGERYASKDNDSLTHSPEWEEYKRVRGLEIKLPKHGIPLHIIKYNLDNDYIGEDAVGNRIKIKKYIEKFEDRFHNKLLYVWGKAGTQKTTVMQYVAKEILSKGLKVEYATMNSLIKVLTNEQFDNDQKFELGKYEAADLLIIDRSFDKEQVTIYNSKYQIAFLDSFLRERIEVEQKATIIISNNSIDEISQNKFNADMEDLIRRSTLPHGLALEFKDHYSIKDDFDASSLWD